MGLKYRWHELRLELLKNSPLKLAVGYRQQALLTIHPQPNDIPMDMVITEDGASFRATET